MSNPRKFSVDYSKYGYNIYCPLCGNVVICSEIDSLKTLLFDCRLAKYKMQSKINNKLTFLTDTNTKYVRTVGHINNIYSSSCQGYAVRNTCNCSQLSSKVCFGKPHMFPATTEPDLEPLDIEKYQPRMRLRF